MSHACSAAIALRFPTADFGAYLQSNRDATFVDLGSEQALDGESGTTPVREGMATDPRSVPVIGKFLNSLGSVHLIWPMAGLGMPDDHRLPHHRMAAESPFLQKYHLVAGVESVVVVRARLHKRIQWPI